MDNQQSLNTTVDLWDDLLKQYVQDAGGEIQTSGPSWYSNDLGEGGHIDFGQPVMAEETNPSVTSAVNTSASYTFTPASDSNSKGPSLDHLRADIQRLKQELEEKCRLLEELTEYVDNSLQPWTVSITEAIKDLNERCDRLERRRE